MLLALESRRSQAQVNSVKRLSTSGRSPLPRPLPRLSNQGPKVSQAISKFFFDGLGIRWLEKIGGSLLMLIRRGVVRLGIIFSKGFFGSKYR